MAVIKKYCIISTPRSGSTWLEFMIISYLQQHNKFAVNLGEFFHPYIIQKERFSLKNTFILKELPGKNNCTIEDRFEMLRNSNTEQPSTIRIFPLSEAFNINYDNVLEFLKEKNFTFLSLRRNIFDTVISFSLMMKNKIVHNFIDHWSSLEGNLKSIKWFKVTIDENKFLMDLKFIKSVDNEVKSLSEKFNATELRYENLIQDCRKYHVPIVDRVGIEKTYGNINPCHMIKNFNELKMIYENYTNS